ncbi:MAG TPA: hypothetical protein VM674_02580 [Candidatus Acidoferrum sp.]|nr:hypothetical protein [Candidatus Acidoferrum sp.]
MARKKNDSVEAVLRKADRTLDQWFRRGAGALRQQVDELQVGLRKLSSNLEQLEKRRKSAAASAKARSAAIRKTSRSRRQKKAA